MQTQLSKSKYLSGTQCPKRLWLEINNPEKATPITAAQQHLFDQGHEIEKLARNQFPDGLLIKGELNQAVTETKNKITEVVNSYLGRVDPCSTFELLEEPSLSMMQ